MKDKDIEDFLKRRMDDKEGKVQPPEAPPPPPPERLPRTPRNLFLVVFISSTIGVLLTTLLTFQPLFLFFLLLPAIPYFVIFHTEMSNFRNTPNSRIALGNKLLFALALSTAFIIAFDFFVFYRPFTQVVIFFTIFLFFLPAAITDTFSAKEDTKPIVVTRDRRPMAFVMLALCISGIGLIGVQILNRDHTPSTFFIHLFIAMALIISIFALEALKDIFGHQEPPNTPPT